MKIENYNSNLSFKHIYSITGNKRQINAAKKIIEEETRKIRLLKITKTIKENGDILTIGVATEEEDVLKINQIGFKRKALQNNINAREMTNPFRTLKFLPYEGKCIRKINIFIQGKELITSNRYEHKNFIQIIRFKKTKTILEALKEIDAIPDEINYQGGGYALHKENIIDMLDFEKDIAQCEDLKKIKVKGVCLQGSTSIVFELPNKYCLKLGFNPNAPLKDEVYDIPTILKRKLKVKNPPAHLKGIESHIYYTIQKRGLNENELYIRPRHLKQVENSILKTDKYSEISDYARSQIALYKGKPYLVDAAVVNSRELYK